MPQRQRDEKGRFVAGDRLVWKFAEAPTFVTVPDVEIISTGHWHASTGDIDVTKAHLQAMVEAQEDPAIRDGVLKLGHTDPRFDGEPAFGRVRNLRLSENGQTLLGDLEEVPAELAELIPSAWPDRSAEMDVNVTTPTGGEFPAVLTGLALLGVAPPAVKGLAEVVDLFKGDAGYSIAASENRPATALLAAVTVDRVRAAYWENVPADDKPGNWLWVREVWVASEGGGFLIVEDDDTAQLYKVPWTVNTKGDLDFAAHEEVKISYVKAGEPGPGARRLAHDLPKNQTDDRASVTVPFSGQPTDPDQEEGMDPKEVRKRLGLAEDASDEQVEERKELLGETRTAELLGEGTPGTEPEPEPAPADDSEPEPTPATQQADGPTVPVDAAALSQLQSDAAAGRQAREEQKRQHREALLSSALKDGRITKASKTEWEKQLTEGPDRTAKAVKETEALLAKLPKVVPTDPVGDDFAPGDDLTADPDLDAIDREMDARFGVPTRQEA